ncbi:hypothetical protein [Amycolatopsis sp.]|uniref:hypothetical protein n=1 Tax=Amycolatopsis sp. TaxID=37632 RepID=UPI002D1A5FA8|nr:hypothetical protein [Amycolatopsis sp.]HVV14073.1 hypothetical protein [Amycolatopsis sp.]
MDTLCETTSTAVDSAAAAPGPAGDQRDEHHRGGAGEPKTATESLASIAVTRKYG